jgi:amino acid transporter
LGQPSLRKVIGPWLLLFFVVGDILGSGIYALVGKVAGEIGFIAWVPFFGAFGVAALTALSYLELVTKYPKAGGVAVFAHRAFKAPFFTFLLGFMVLGAGVSVAAAGATAFAANLAAVIGLDSPKVGPGLPLLALVFTLAIMAVNLYGVSESMRFNVICTLIELSGLLIIIAIGAWALLHGQGDVSQLTTVEVMEGDSLFPAFMSATTLTFYAIVGFENSVNMAEEVTEPYRVFPRAILIGMGITLIVYVLVTAVAVSLVAPSVLGEGEAPLLKVVTTAAPGFPLEVFAVITMFAVANTALIYMLMPSRLLYGMAHERVLPAVLGKVGHRRRTPWVATLLAAALTCCLLGFADLRTLAETASILTAGVFAVCNISVLVLRRDPVAHKHFRTPTAAAVLGAASCIFLVSPLTGRPAEEYAIGGALLALGVVVWCVRWAAAKATQARRT